MIAFDKFWREARIRFSRLDMLLKLCAVAMLASLLLGGGTRVGFLGDNVLQILATPLLLLVLLRLTKAPTERGSWIELIFCCLLWSVPLLQLIPVPPWMWGLFPGRQSVKDLFSLIGQQSVWLPVSLSPDTTLVATLSLIAPVGLFLGVRMLDVEARRHLVIIVLFVAGVSVFFGMSQIGAGPNSRLRLFANTNPTEAVGFFANRNHFAALLYSSLMLVSPWLIDAGVKLSSSAGKGAPKIGPAVLVFIGAGTLAFLLAAAQIMTRSRAGLGLTALAMLGAGALIFSDKRKFRRRNTLKAFAIGLICLGLFTAQFGFSRVSERFAYDLVGNRADIFWQTLEAAKAYFPFGSGFGTFVQVFSTVERKEDLLTNAFVNHAHDDYVEFLLEGGVASIVLVGIFLCWFAFHARRVWAASSKAQPIDTLLARAASIAVLLLLIHSAADYPLRTGAIMAVFALCCGLLTKAPPKLQRSREYTRFDESWRDDFAEKHESQPRGDIEREVVKPRAPKPNQIPLEHQGAEPDLPWPEEWK